MLENKNITSEERTFMRRRNLLFSLIIGSFLLLSGFSMYLFVKKIQLKPLPIYWKINNFSLISSDGEQFQLEHLNNKVWVADFFFTTCSSICPLMTKNMSDLHNKFKQIKGVDFVSISVNPEQDTSDILSEYAKKYQADTDKWHFLTGSRKAITDIAVNSFKIGSIEEPIFHSPNFVLVDRKAQIRGYYDGTVKEEVEKLSKDLAQLIKEK